MHACCVGPRSRMIRMATSCRPGCEQWTRIQPCSRRPGALDRCRHLSDERNLLATGEAYRMRCELTKDCSQTSPAMLGNDAKRFDRCQPRGVIQPHNAAGDEVGVVGFDHKVKIAAVRPSLLHQSEHFLRKRAHCVLADLLTMAVGERQRRRLPRGPMHCEQVVIVVRGTKPVPRRRLWVGRVGRQTAYGE